MNQEAGLRKKEIAKEIFSPVITKFQRIQIQTHYKDECWSIDLIDRSSLSKYNKNHKFIFTIFDNHTKYAWAIPLKDKSGKSTTTAFKKLIETSMRKPQKVWSDRGKEFYNQTFIHFLKEQNIQVYSTNSDLKAVFEGIPRSSANLFTINPSNPQQVLIKDTTITFLGSSIFYN